MLGSHYYHEIMRKSIVSFGTLFNNIHIKHYDGQTDDVVDEMRVPLAYAPRQKFLARLTQQSDLNKAVAISLPRMSFEMTSLTYDGTRKTGMTQTFRAVDTASSTMRKVYMPVPYNIGFELNVYCKLNDDALQIVEQILPFFQPSLNVTIDLVKSIGEKRDVPLILQNISFTDDYEGNYETRRALVYTFTFTAKTYMFGPIADTTDGLIRKVQLDYYSDTNTRTASREMRYRIESKAKKDYNEDGYIDQLDDPLIPPGDDFGFTESREFFGDSKDYSPTRKVDI